ncbi:hypothetical protein GCM10010335_26450 [Streptomyces galbus]|nr:hypothetical protein GCM10010335_26450 [Streptomyces galbus]
MAEAGVVTAAVTATAEVSAAAAPSARRRVSPDMRDLLGCGGNGDPVCLPAGRRAGEISRNRLAAIRTITHNRYNLERR